MNEEIRYLSIIEATKYLRIKHDQYTRRLLHEGKFDTPLVAEKRDMGHYSKWFIAKVSLDYYQEHKRIRSGQRRFLLRADLDQESKIRKALDKLQIDYTLELSYQKKES